MKKIQLNKIWKLTNEIEISKSTNEIKDQTNKNIEIRYQTNKNIKIRYQQTKTNTTQYINITDSNAN